MGSRHELLPSQEEALFKLIVAFKFEPEQFSFDKESYSTVFRHKATRYYFEFSRHHTPQRREWLRLTYSPSQYLAKDETTMSPGDWPKLHSYFRSWLEYLRRELNTKNPWDDILKQKELSEAAATIGEENTPFTSDEISLISSKLDEIKDLLVAKNLVDEEQQTAIESQLKYLGEAAKRQGRRDWVFLALGVIVQLGFEKALTPAAFKVIGPIFIELFRQVSAVVRLLSF